MIVHYKNENEIAKYCFFISSEVSLFIWVKMNEFDGFSFFFQGPFMNLLKALIFRDLVMKLCGINWIIITELLSQHYYCIKVQPRVSFLLKHAVMIRRPRSMTVCTVLLGPGLWLLHTGALMMTREGPMSWSTRL